MGRSEGMHTNGGCTHRKDERDISKRQDITALVGCVFCDTSNILARIESVLK